MNDFYISTIDENAGTLASKYGLGIEIADFCTAWNMDERLAETDAQVQKNGLWDYQTGTPRSIQ